MISRSRLGCSPVRETGENAIARGQKRKTHLFGLFLGCPVIRGQGIFETGGKLPQWLLLWLPLHGAECRGGCGGGGWQGKKVEVVCRTRNPAINGFQSLEKLGKKEEPGTMSKKRPYNRDR